MRLARSPLASFFWSGNVLKCSWHIYWGRTFFATTYRTTEMGENEVPNLFLCRLSGAKVLSKTMNYCIPTATPSSSFTNRGSRSRKVTIRLLYSKLQSILRVINLSNHIQFRNWWCWWFFFLISKQLYKHSDKKLARILFRKQHRTSLLYSNKLNFCIESFLKTFNKKCTLRVLEIRCKPFLIHYTGTLLN